MADADYESSTARRFTSVRRFVAPERLRASCPAGATARARSRAAGARIDDERRGVATPPRVLAAADSTPSSASHARLLSISALIIVVYFLLDYGLGRRIVLPIASPILVIVAVGQI